MPYSNSWNMDNEIVSSKMLVTAVPFSCMSFSVIQTDLWEVLLIWRLHQDVSVKMNVYSTMSKGHAIIGFSKI